MNYFMKTSRDEFDRLMETCPGIDRGIVDMFKKQLTTGIDKHDILRKNKNFNRLIKPELFNEINSLKDVVYKRSDKPSEIDIEEKNKIEKLITEKYLYNEKVSKVNGFIGAFQNKYSRRPSQEEIFSNLKNEVGIPEIRIITEQIDSN